MEELTHELKKSRWVIVLNAARRRNPKCRLKKEKMHTITVAAVGVCIVLNQWAHHINKFRIWV